MGKRIFKQFLLVLVACLGVSAIFGILWLRRELEPTAAGQETYFRVADQTGLHSILNRMQREGYIRNADALRLYARYKKTPALVREGTYKLRPGMEADQILAAIHNPVRQMVRLPETNLLFRTANLLEKHEVTTAEEYLELTKQPQHFQKYVSFPLPQEGSLDGYLYPDTYDLPPMLGAEGVIKRQLQNFERKVIKQIGMRENMNEILTIASMIELEVAKDEERPVVAGVIQNRLKKNMRLQIDATVLYGLGEWRRLTFADYRNTDSPYNTYRINGLPPGPICSPTIKSIEAALEPAEHDYIYYVALPTGYHLFSTTYAQHLANIEKRKKALREQAS
jgi:UPF0755 protein